MAVEPGVFQLRISLAQLRPEIWRRVIVSGAMRLDQLHLVMQEAMGWSDAHLHQFRIGEVTYGAVPDDEDDDESELESDYSLSGLVSPGDRFFYDYDFGDDWVHEVVVERKVDAGSDPRLAVVVDGANACPAEDSGGVIGYTALLEALRNPGHNEHSESRRVLGADFDPTCFDLERAQVALERIW